MKHWIKGTKIWTVNGDECGSKRNSDEGTEENYKEKKSRWEQRAPNGIRTEDISNAT
jgi:hypothetical protein